MLASLRFPFEVVLSTIHQSHVHISGMEWIGISTSELVGRMKSIPFDVVKSCIQHLPFHHRPEIRPRCPLKNCAGLVEHVILRAHFLASIGFRQLCNIFVAHYPYDQNDGNSESDTIRRILEFEYDTSLIQSLASGQDVQVSKSVRMKRKCREEKQEVVNK